MIRLNIFIILLPIFSFSQDKVIKLSDKQAVQIAIENAIKLKNADLQIDKKRIGAWKYISLSPLKLSYKEKKLGKDFFSKNTSRLIYLNQTIESLLKTYYDFISENNREEYLKTDRAIQKLKIEKDVMYIYNQWLFDIFKYQLVSKQLNSVNEIIALSKKMIQNKEISSFDHKSLKMKLYNFNSKFVQAKKNMLQSETALKSILMIEDSIAPIEYKYYDYVVDRKGYEEGEVKLLDELNKNEIEVLNSQINSQWARLFPKLYLSFGLGLDTYNPKFNDYTDISIGISIPILTFDIFYSAEQKELEKKIAINRQSQYKFDIINQYKKNNQILLDLENSLNFVDISLIKDFKYLDDLYSSFKNGDMNILDYYKEIINYYSFVISYMQQLKYKNETIILLNYLENLI